jgi:hypothetical protein
MPQASGAKQTLSTEFVARICPRPAAALAS